MRHKLDVLLAASAASLLLATSVAAQGIADRVPLDDPGVSGQMRHEITSVPPASAAGSYLGAAAGSALDAAAWTMEGLVKLPRSAGQFLWELSYLMGVNATPIDPPHVPDPSPPIQAIGAPAERPADVAVTMAEIVVMPTAPTPTAPIGPQSEVDAGLIANFVYDRGNRREDGSYFIPKPLQRLFNVRTERARIIDMPRVTRIAGRIVPDPALYGTVQPSVAGRLEPPEIGFPTLGQTVKRGELLAWVSPSIGVVDRSQVRRDVARLTTDIRVETEALEILRQFSWVPFREGKIYQAEQRIAGLRQQRDALLPMLDLREALRAPTDGVVSAMAAINGRIVQPGEVVFDVIDPSRLWVEATAPDSVTAELARGAPVAAAVTSEGTNLIVRFVGTGLSATRQSTPVLYRIDSPPPGLRVGRPVTVTVVNTANLQRGVLVNRTAVSQGSSGLEEVWEQTAPEVFVPHPVKTRVIDGASVLVLDGVAEGARIVVNGSRLMAQLQ